MSQASVRRFFLPWEQHLLPQAVDYLAGNWQGSGPLDLSRLMVVVPTAQAGRRLREALAAHAAKFHQAVFAPRVLTPEVLITAREGVRVATPLEATLAWVDVFLALDLGEYREVFPVDPPVKNFSWATRLTQQFLKLQVTLAEGGLRIGDVGPKAGKFPEAARWRQLGALENRHAAKLADIGCIGSAAANILAAQNPLVPTGLDKIVILATPDPLPLAIQALERIAETLPVEVVVFAPETEAENFDHWGRPVVAAWERRALALPEFEQQVHLCADPAAQAERMAKIAAGYGEPEGLLAVGSVDGEVWPPLEGALRAARLNVFNPGGLTQRQAGFYQLLAALAALEKESTFEVVERLARCPDFGACLRVQLGGGFFWMRWLSELDELRERHLPASLEVALEYATRKTRSPDLARALAVIAEIRRLLIAGPFVESAPAALGFVFGERVLAAGRDADLKLEEAISEWMSVVQACADAAPEFSALRRSDWWELALQMFGSAQLGSEKPAGAVELQGWLELPWEDAPHLLVAGFNDGRVPEAVSSDVFLPESLRETLGLKTNAARLVRDAYMLQAMSACRSERGRIDLFFGKTSASGDPLRPSRLLLRCPDEALAARVKFLFRDPDVAAQTVAWTRAWRLAPRRVESPARVSVTALRSWLKCPLRFYFRFVLGMEPVDPAKSELDARDFGTLCHTALEAMGRDAVAKNSTDENFLREFLLSEFERAVRQQFGAELTLPLLVQVESARQRLSKAAVVQARERAAGWTIIEVERKFELPVAGMVIAGKIDRIERNELTGAVRVLDYKTSDTAVSPVEVHLGPVREGETLPDWQRVESAGKPRAWMDLQLPIYLEAVAPEFGAGVACGYFNLPKAAGETGLAWWDEYPPELRTSAWRCVEGICAAIRAGEFWPPRELKGRDAELDDFAELFHHGAAASIAWREATS